ncbi:BRO family protein [Aureimonas sp. AU12]|uniref:BRO-N domain-containing protein n=1 Tax=Aureimonas sp. AU12 TaxID=1638161 RepID=UPI0007864DAB|nr:BRO family protein [Aureimonas sp. AU12]
MSALATFDFEFESQPIRFLTVDGREAVIGKDMALAIGVARYRDVFGRIPADEKGAVSIRTLGGPQKMVVLYEPGMYRLIFESRKQAAERFKSWVFGTVLPEIRRTGRFGGATAKPELDSVLALARSCELVRRIHGRPAAQRLWSEMGGMPLPVDEERAARRSPPAGEAPRSTASPPSARNMRQLKDVRRFLRCCCRQVRGGKVGARTLYAAYAAWAPIVNAERLTQTMFGLLMRQTEIEREDGRRRHYLGLKLTDIATHRMRHT